VGLGVCLAAIDIVLSAKEIFENKYSVLSGQVLPESSHPTDRPAAKPALTGIFFARNCLSAEDENLSRLPPLVTIRSVT
jgi:hypothetical protein